MVEDALDGKIDLIVTKSVSRFARNTVDSLTTVRQLKEKVIEIYFEKNTSIQQKALYYRTFLHGKETFGV
jgi:DNA invertase Pin-like site-specific DNA recombinase